MDAVFATHVDVRSSEFDTNSVNYEPWSLLARPTLREGTNEVWAVGDEEQEEELPEKIGRRSRHLMPTVTRFPFQGERGDSCWNHHEEQAKPPWIPSSRKMRSTATEMRIRHSGLIFIHITAPLKLERWENSRTTRAKNLQNSRLNMTATTRGFPEKKSGFLVLGFCSRRTENERGKSISAACLRWCRSRGEANPRTGTLDSELPIRRRCHDR